MPRNPTNWDEYQYGTSHRSSISSSTGGRSVHLNGEGEAEVPYGERQEGDDSVLRRRGSSMAMRLNSLTQVGGVNSIGNFARSWTRAAGFHEATSRRPSFILADSDTNRGAEDAITYGRTDTEYGGVPRTSLIRAHLEASRPGHDIDDESLAPEVETGGRRGSDSAFATTSLLATPSAGSYGTSYGTLQSTLSESSMAHAGQLWRQQQASRVDEGGREPLIVKEVEQDGKIVLAVAGQSTLPQTIFNSINVLIGVGLLSLPMGFKYAGWVCGMTFLLLSAVVTSYTARLLAKCMDVDASLITFADLAFISYGQNARIATSVLFTLELVAACVALVVLFADTLNLLIPGVGVDQWKILSGLLLIPLNFVPLRLLSFSSVVGIFSCFCIVLILFVDGIIKPEAPGSLREPAQTYLFPENWLTLPLSFGLLMSPWGGHSVFPNIYRDMRHPQKFKKAVKVTFSFTYLLDCATAVVGILMFGDGVMTEITANLIQTSGYPRSLSIIMSICIAIIPLTKIPLNSRPIVSTIEVLSGLDPQALSGSPSLTGLSGYSRGLLKIAIRILVIISFVAIAIAFPEFDSIMAFMGSTLCFTICVILPLLFYLKIFGREISMRERLLDYFLIAVCFVLAVVGTVWAFLPKSLVGAE